MAQPQVVGQRAQPLGWPGEGAGKTWSAPGSRGRRAQRDSEHAASDWVAVSRIILCFGHFIPQD